MNEKNTKSPARSRLTTLDSLRGLALISMILYHFTWDLVYIVGLPWAWYESKAAELWQQSICWTFILLSGFCVALSSHPLRRGWIIFGCGAAVTLVTALFLPEDIVIYGILTFMGTAMILTAALQYPLKKLKLVPSAILALVFFGLFLVTKQISYGYLDCFGSHIALPDFLYANYLTAFFGFMPRGFYSTDYFPLLPWIFLYLTGYMVSRILVNVREGRMLTKKAFHINVPGVSFIGRHTLLIYMAHQPLLYGICLIIMQMR